MHAIERSGRPANITEKKSVKTKTNEYHASYNLFNCIPSHYLHFVFMQKMEVPVGGNSESSWLGPTKITWTLRNIQTNSSFKISSMFAQKRNEIN